MSYPVQGEGYNERIFEAGGLRSSLHLARFDWVRRKILQHSLASDTILELGCYDGRLLDWLPVAPRAYVGIDANWEGGLDLARQRFEAAPGVSFVNASHPRELGSLRAEEFDLGVCLETLEHVPPGVLPDYLRFLRDRIKGALLITVPNEMGIVFALKWLYKRFLLGGAERYSPAEFCNATLYRMHRIERLEHKGFDYRELRGQLAAHFDVRSVESIPLPFMPPALSFSVGIVASAK